MVDYSDILHHTKIIHFFIQPDMALCPKCKSKNTKRRRKKEREEEKEEEEKVVEKEEAEKNA